jgi:transposase
LRSLLVVGATAVTQHVRRGARVSAWLAALLARRPAKVASIAWANKMARIVWALLTKGGTFSQASAAAVVA